MGARVGKCAAAAAVAQRSQIGHRAKLHPYSHACSLVHHHPSNILIHTCVPYMPSPAHPLPPNMRNAADAPPPPAQPCPATMRRLTLALLATFAAWQEWWHAMTMTQRLSGEEHQHACGLAGSTTPGQPQLQQAPRQWAGLLIQAPVHRVRPPVHIATTFLACLTSGS